MNPLERQVAALLQDAPGEPPMRIDADELLTHRPPRRWLAPALAAAVVSALGITLAITLSGDSNNPPRPKIQAQLPTPGAESPKAVALRDLQQLLDDAPLPPGAQLAHEVSRLRVPFGTGSPNDLDRARFYSTPGTVAAALAYVKHHVPGGMTLDSSGSSSGGGVPDVESVTYVSPTKLFLSYSMTSGRGGIAIRVDAQTTWVPNRPSWSFVPDSVTSVDVTIVRKAYNKGMGGAPTVRRTLTGDRARELAAAVNDLPPAAPEGIHSCPAMLVDASDVVVFHSPNGNLRLAHTGGGCAFNAAITAPPSKREALVPGAAFTNAVLRELGLPVGYGMR
jgi:hypothetical protein